MHAEDIGVTTPKVVKEHNVTPTITGESHVAFDVVWFNYDGNNYHFDTSKGNVYLYIDGENVLDLTQMVATELPNFTCRMFNASSTSSGWNARGDGEKHAENLVNDHKGGFLCKKDFTGSRYRSGTVALSNPCKNGSTKAYKVTFDLCLEEYHDGMTHDVRIVGPWINKSGSVTNYTYETTPCQLTIKAPSFTAPPAPTIKRTGNRKASYAVSQLASSYTTHQVNGSSNVSKFYYSAMAWSSAPTDNTAGKPYWGWGTETGSNTRLLWTDVKDGSTSKTFEMPLPNNYNPVTVYPRIRLWTDPAYEMNPSGANNIVKQLVGYNKDYTAVSLPGYARPSGLTVNSNMWTREVTISWIPEVANKENYNAYGKWVVFRQKTGEPKTQVFYGETDYVTYTPGKEVMLETTARKCTLPEYNQEYTYIVAFQPYEWGLGSGHIESEKEAVDLNTSKNHTISRVNPLNTIEATNDRSDNTIAVKWTFNSFGDASSSKKYYIKIFRREKVGKDQDPNPWSSSPVFTQEVVSPTDSVGSFDNTGITSSRITYEYMAEVEAMGIKFSSPNVAEGKLDGSSKVLNVNASRGAYSGVVRISWTAKQVGSETTYYVVKRRLLGSSADYQEIYSTSGVATSYSFEDNTAQPGCYYQYMVDCYNVEIAADGKTSTYPGTGAYTDGFALATGVVNGRVAYGSGTAVEGVKVSLVNTSSGESPQSQFRSMSFGNPGSGAGLVWTADTTKIQQLLVGKSWSVQMNVFPDATKMNVNNKAYIVWDSKETASIYFVYNKPKNCYTLQAYLGGRTLTSALVDIPANKWTNIVLAINAETGKWNVGAVYDDGRSVYYTDNYQAGGISSSKSSNMVIGNSSSINHASSFAGNIDEFRFFTKCLTADDIKKNYDHRLSGSEDGLAIYYPMDEGIEKQAFVYDYSRTGGIANGRHATVEKNTSPSTNVPAENQFSICAYTNSNGNYSVSGIPFTGDGTSYSIIPTMGTHKFSAQEANRFISAQSLVHNGVDFTDVSSFPVKGTVYYKGTTYPVVDATIYVDGIVAGRNGAAVTTNTNGEYVVDVPIGSHFISVKKNGHTFQNAGRYPADPDEVNTTYVFEDSVPNLNFYDETLVTVAGRVVGGDIQDAYPLGFGQSKANIGQATIVLEAEGNHYMNATDEGAPATTKREFATDIIAKSGTATVGAYSAQDPTAIKQIVITTNAETGEFAALMPPLKYNVKSIKTASYSFPNDNLPVIDATNPLITNTDSMEYKNEKGQSVYERFEYAASMKKKFKSQPVLQIIGNNADGSFGDSLVVVEEKHSNKADSVKMYTNDKGEFKYKFGAPVFSQLQEYTFGLKGYELYENKDTKGTVVTDSVALEGVEVTFQNEFAITTGVNPDDVSQVNVAEGDVVTLDEFGKGTYKFQVGLPNIVAPYKRNLTVTYSVDGQTYTWKDTPWTNDIVGEGRGAFNAIILGQMPSGNNFMTSGPDKVTMILRDPAGTGSSSTWAKETTHTKTTKTSFNFTSDNEVNSTVYLGVETQTGEGVGFMVIQDLESKVNLEVGAEVTIKANRNNTTTTTTTTTKEISTSDGSDFVGSVGDVFIGTATNIIFGDARTVCLVKDGDDYDLTMEDQITIGQKFGTSFNYTQNYIENVLIPTFEEQRNALLEQVETLDEKKTNRPAAGKEPKYETLLSPESDDFGQPDTYLMIEPADFNTEVYEDKVNWYNMQISAWTKILADNERAKVTAIKNRSKYLKDNYSFDAGSRVSESTETSKSDEWENEESEEIKLSVGAESGYRFSGVGLSASVKTTDGEEFVQSQGGNTENKTTFTFELAEDGDDDYLSVDVFDAPDGFGPIFYTRGGATCCPYEDEVVTKYYNPGTVISEKTVQIELPEIAPVSFSTITGVPSGKDAEMSIQLRNLSETSEDGWYNINVVDTSNPDGLQVWIDGYNVTNGRTILIPAGEGVVKKVYFRQSNTAITEYKDVVLRVSSVCQPDNTGIFPEIASVLPVSVTFQPAGSDIELATSETVVNTYTTDSLTLSMRGYDINAKALESVRLQYKGLNDAQWLTLKEYVKDGDPRLSTDKSLGKLIAIEGNNTLDYKLDLRDALYTDQTYVFRAQTVCASAGAYIYGESANLQVVRDMNRPQLMGNASPADGVLNPGDEISVLFNEDVRTNELGKVENFSVRGILNDSQLTHDAALQLTSGGDGAKTLSTIDLSNRSFSIGAWMKYSAAGHIFQQGEGTTGFDVSVNALDQLEVTYCGQKLTSAQTLKKDTWLYLSVAYDNDEKMVNANYAYDSYDFALLKNKTLAATAHTLEPAAFSVGRGLTGSMHEVTLWDNARNWDEAQGSIYTAKSKSTRGLIGYWKMDEGHGTMAVDCSRGRNMAVPAANAWSIAQENRALMLDGNAVVQLPITESLKSTDNYTIETWFMASKDNKAAASIIGFGEQKLDVRLNASGAMEVVCGSSVSTVSTKDYRDGQWHHLALNVLRSESGRATVYVDGESLKQVGSVPALQTAAILVGASINPATGTPVEIMKGGIDDVRIWSGSRSAETILANINNRVNGADEPSLMLYYPFEESVIDSYQQTVVQATMADKSPKAGTNELTYIVGSSLQTDNKVAPSLKAAPRKENIPFSFVADERRIVINIETGAARLEGCNVEFTVRDICDKNGNYSMPVTWTAYVQQNQLKWSEDNIELTKSGSESVSFSIDVANLSGSNDNWSISGLPAWLTADVENGSLQPLASKKINFTVKDGVEIGSHEAVVYLTGSLGINTPLVVSLTNLGDVPAWSVNASDYESTMNINGQLVVNGIPSKDKNDIVAAFRGSECVGIASPKYYSRYDAYFVMMNVYGNGNDNGEPLTFKVYDASTGKTFPVEETADARASKFEADVIVGTMAQPYVWNTTDKIEQNFDLKAGWQWISFAVTPDKKNASTLLSGISQKVKTMVHENLTYTPVSNAIKKVASGTMYKINMKEATPFSVIGTAVDLAESPITIKSGWNWIGYSCIGNITLEEAFAELNPQNDDMIKSQTGFATWMDYEWVGTLEAMHSGMGYQYLSQDAATRQFHYPAATSSSSTARKAMKRSADADEQEAISQQWSSNMNMIAVVTRQGMPVEAKISVIDTEGNTRAVSSQSIRDDRHFITIAGEGHGAALKFVVNVDGFDYIVPGTLFYSDDTVIGTLSSPFVIDLDSPTGIGRVDVDSLDDAESIYDLSGRNAKTVVGTQVMIVNGKKIVIRK